MKVKINTTLLFHFNLSWFLILLSSKHMKALGLKGQCHNNAILFWLIILLFSEEFQHKGQNDVWKPDLDCVFFCIILLYAKFKNI